MKKLGIIGAMTTEVETLVSSMENAASKEIAGSTFYEGMLEGLPAVIVQCGVGKVNAALCAQILCTAFGVTHLVNTGIAGSLCAQLDIGDLVVSQDAMYHDFDCVHFGYPYGKVPGMDTLAFPANEGLMAYAMEGAAIAQTAYRNQVPFVIIRAISDKADNSAEMDYPTFETLSAHRCAQVTSRMAHMLLEEEILHS